MKKIAVILIAFACMGLLLLDTCKKETSAGGVSKLAVRLKDAPATWDHVKIQVRGIRLLSDVDGWITIPINDTIIDILQLQDTSALLGTINLHAGTITEVHLLLGFQDTVVIAGIPFVISVTGNGDDDDISIKVHEIVGLGGTFVMTLDLNAAESIVGDADGHWHMRGHMSEGFRRGNGHDD